MCYLIRDGSICIIPIARLDNPVNNSRVSAVTLSYVHSDYFCNEKNSVNIILAM
jgi:hypothetical protein